MRRERFLLTVAATFAVALFLGRGDAYSAEPPKGHTKDTLETVRKRLKAKKAVLADVREQREWDAGHLKAAALVPLSRLRSGADDKDFVKELTKTLPKDKIVYLHCRSGGRVLAAAPILRKLGYDVRPLSAGYRSLLEFGFKKAE